MQIGRFRSSIVDRDENQDILMGGLGIFDNDIEVAIVVEHTGLAEFVFPVLFPAPPVFFDEPGIREFSLRIFVEKLHVGMRRRGIEIKIRFLDIFPMVAFVAGEAEQTFFQNGITAIPEGEGQADFLMAVGNASEAVFSPPIRPRTGVIVREKFPGRAAWTIVLTDGAPLPLAQVRSPSLPMYGSRSGLLQPLLFTD